MSTEKIAFINLITTIVLCIITAIYARITYLMQKDQRKHLEITNRPYFSFDHLAMGTSKEGSIVKALQPQLYFKNVGNVMLEYSIEEIEFVVNNVVSKNGLLKSTGGYVFPKMDATFYFPLEESFNSTTLKEINDVSIRYKLSYKISETKTSYISEKTLEFQFSITSDQSFEILFKNERET